MKLGRGSVQNRDVRNAIKLHSKSFEAMGDFENRGIRKFHKNYIQNFVDLCAYELPQWSRL